MFNPHSVDGHRTRLRRALARESLVNLLGAAVTDPTDEKISHCGREIAAVAGFDPVHAQRLAREIVFARRSEAGLRNWSIQQRKGEGL